METQTPAFTFLQNVYKALDEAPKDDVRLHRNEAKFLLEEKLPIALLAFSLDRLGNHVTVSYLGKDHPKGDAIINRFGREILVEVTFCRTYEDSLRSELVVEQGSAPGAGPITRNKKTGFVEGTVTAVNFDYDVNRIAKQVLECIQQKNEMSYPNGTTLIVAFEHPADSQITFWTDLHKLISGADKGQFSGVYLCNITYKQIMCFI